MKTKNRTTPKTVELPSGKLPVKKYIQEVAKVNDLNHTYLIIREKIPITWQQVKTIWNEALGIKKEVNN